MASIDWHTCWKPVPYFMNIYISLWDFHCLFIYLLFIIFTGGLRFQAEICLCLTLYLDSRWIKMRWSCNWPWCTEIQPWQMFLNQMKQSHSFMVYLVNSFFNPKQHTIRQYLHQLGIKSVAQGHNHTANTGIWTSNPPYISPTDQAFTRCRCGLAWGFRSESYGSMRNVLIYLKSSN